MLRYKLIPVTPLVQNCSLVWCDQTNKAVLIDPGGDVDLLLAEVEREKVELVEIWLTHGHLDHAGGAQELRERLAISVIGPAIEDKFWLDAIEQHSALYGITGMRNVTPNQWLKEGDTLSLGQETLSVYFTPGHTPGHLTFFHSKQKLAWVGDVLFAGSIGRTDFPQSDLSQLLQSVTNKLWPLGNDVTFIPGHGPQSTFGHERDSNPFVSDRALRSAE